MKLQHFSHIHPLVFNEDQPSSEGDKAICSGCGELVSGPSFSCMACGFYLDKKCAEAPSELAHPVHRNHNFNLLVSKPYKSACTCDFCNKNCENFVYHCSCNLELHIKCALFSHNIAENKIGELQIAHIDPLISTEVPPEELKKLECFACWKSLLDCAYLSLDSGFCLHKKCVELPLEINQLCHRQHSLFLQFNSQRLSCQICQKTQRRGFVYCCTPCQFVLHIECSAITQLNHLCYHKHPLSLQINSERLPCQICQKAQRDQIVYCCSICTFCLHTECASPPPTIKDRKHQHPFILFQRHVSYICDVCGTRGNYVSYICSTCGIIVHKDCISLSRIVKFYWHEHNMSHTYFLEQYEFDMWECSFCNEEVKKDHGGYFCSKCNYIVHVKCATQDSLFYKEVDSAETIDGSKALLENETAKSIKHFSHQHDWALSEEIKNDIQCNGYVLSISSSYYCCSQCDFVLHKSCAALPIKKHIWFHPHQDLHELFASSDTSICTVCKYETNGFVYKCNRCWHWCCLRCASVSETTRCQGHEHLLQFHRKFQGSCNACGKSLKGAYRCKICNFNLHHNCLILPLTARHKSDEHHLKLMYRDNNNYSECYYCDICEKERNPNHWFYNCAICDNSAHPNCVLGKYSFIKPRSTSTFEHGHRHRLTLVQKVHFYPECHKCRKACLDLAFECKEILCRYIVHFECITGRVLSLVGDTGLERFVRSVLMPVIIERLSDYWQFIKR